MNRLLSFILVLSAVVSLSSCGISYNIEGSSDIIGLDSRMMYLKTYMDNDLKDLDSTEVVHGKFAFAGSTDSVRFAYLTVTNANMPLPLVLETGDIKVSLNKGRNEWGGTPLNDKLYKFVKSLDSLKIQLQELEHEYTLAFMDGEDMNEVIPRLSRSNQEINMRIDTLVTQSIIENFDNILGPGIFMLFTQQTLQYPQMLPWVVDIMSKATDNFKSDSYVRWFLDKAKYIQDVQNGLETPADAAPAQTAPSQGAPAADAQQTPQPPTPNELAAPASSDSTAVQ